MFFIDIKVNNLKIDKYQKKVIKSKSQNILVIAGAGSGKTFTIIAKIKYLINRGLLPEEILCISFTKASSENLEEKLKKENININVKTFHKLGYEIIRQYKNVSLDDTILEKTIKKEVEKNKCLKEILKLKFIRLGYPDQIFNRLETNIILNTKYKKILIETIKTFINLYKSNNYRLKEFKNFYKVNNKHLYEEKKRHTCFLKLTKRIIINYEKKLKKEKKIDYHDMINLSTKIIRTKGIFPYKYIIIDEYQDISLNKVKLIKEIQKKTNAKLMAVGDDWQSIYSFTGSNLEVFTNFKQIFKKAKIIKLKNTYRNSKELIKITKKFICKNQKQIRKRLKSNKKNKTPIYVYYYKENIEEIWREIIKNISKKTLILGRNNNDIEKIPIIKENMQYLTIHKSKGLESEDTIIVNLEDHFNGIPSKIKDSEYLIYVKPKIDKYKYAEERRLFYVALTRAKNNNYLLVKKDNPSEFIKEILKSNKKNIIEMPSTKNNH
ncbi:MAG: UvrD-helicase domain-containing protein [Bacilli bacterium]|nr:UvrD-helicase domain-containing protein [Bacilli bacterium]